MGELTEVVQDWGTQGLVGAGKGPGTVLRSGESPRALSRGQGVMRFILLKIGWKRGTSLWEVSGGTVTGQAWDTSLSAQVPQSWPARLTP